MRMAALLIALAAIGAAVVAGCTVTTGGQASAPSESVSEYRAYVSQSVEASRSEESKRQETSRAQAQADACETFAMTSNAAVSAGNDLISVMNDEGGYGSSAEAKVGPVINALNTSAGQIDSVKAKAQTDELRDALTQYVDQSRKLAGAFDNRLSSSTLNSVVRTFNDARDRAGKICEPLLQTKGR
ncbi:hypothetical protein [Mycobacteroides immunogenum]|uniref:Lipoprotein n=1 Tax=Mycobacteroides immunogenum TaxID=83262 RepID=A0A7V8RUV3_9MYCO|nr:hypothetical protein [Mycobacteroides immunogenum]AMT70607.1 hypothetical protein ABG82_10095 [Mycobacteroides immunogenum]ANO03690.1 hypothetical protein BAB75_10150 [Mycobacteroides immunogenum]KIU38022.1 hypothetical protein TL11_24395 [Mycobacteroides immunogenum]KPG04558.1 hypothetical protein AN909_22590 [Mycobacteroides immunogenum]KPG05303.1 hypothetical protein AN908_22990 [Mycobacteroides immunogenum]